VLYVYNSTDFEISVNNSTDFEIYPNNSTNVEIYVNNSTDFGISELISVHKLQLQPKMYK